MGSIIYSDLFFLFTRLKNFSLCDELKRSATAWGSPWRLLCGSPVFQSLAVPEMSKFCTVLVSSSELCLQNVLQAGQAFRWVLDEERGLYSTSMQIPGFGGYGVIKLRQPDDKCVEFSYMHPQWDEAAVRQHLQSYFRLEVNLENLMVNDWQRKDPRFKGMNSNGIRILAQEPWETLVSFICSSNNNISRITKMCHSLCDNFGNKIHFEEEDSDTYSRFYSFPTSEEIVERATEQDLRDLGFGYRAKYIIETAKVMVLDKQQHHFTHDWEFLQYLAKAKDYLEAREYLMKYTGVGPKVADCVCLMGLHIDSVVPVDVHVGRIAKRDYNIAATKADISALREQYNKLPITKKKINLELDFIRKELLTKWGDYAGWAQGVLFFKEVGSTSGATTTGNIRKRKLKIEEAPIQPMKTIKIEQY